MALTNLLQIIFHFGNSYPEDGGIGLLDLANTIVGAAIGSGATIWALYRTFKQDKKKEETKRIEFQKEKVKYLQSLFRSIKTGLSEQISFFEKYSQTIKASPDELPLFPFVPLNELDRVVNKVDQEDYYHSYLGEFGDNQQIIDEFRDLISYLNYFDGEMNIIKESIRNSLHFHHERQVSLKRIIENAMEYAAELLINKEIIQNHPAFANYINEVMIHFHSIEEGKKDLKFHQENFVEVLIAGIIGFAKQIPEAHHLAIQLKNATISYTSIQQHNIDVADDFEALHKKMHGQFQRFAALSKRLEDYSSSNTKVQNNN